MRTGFQRRKRWKKMSLLWLTFSLVLLSVGVFELYRWIVPYQSENPLFHEATIGEQVIRDWKYGGLDEEGYLRFYNGQQTAVLPPSSRIFGADGTFVVIERFTPSSLTYADPIEAIPPKWFGLLGVILFIGCGIGLWRFKRRPRTMRTRKAKSTPSLTSYYPRTAALLKTQRRTKKFRPSVKRSLWQSKSETKQSPK